MNDDQMHAHLSQIATHWTMLDQAHKGDAAQAAVARRVLMERYCGAVFRYLLASVKDRHTAEDLMQTFAVNFIEGKYAAADREKGKFRKYIKTALFNMVKQHFRGKAGKAALSIEQDDVAVAAPDESAAADEAYRESWRQELLARAWRGLQRVESESSTPYHAVLRLEVDEPKMGSREMAEVLGARLGKAMTEAGVRQYRKRAREKFGEMLLEDIRRSLDEAGDDALREELAELRLLKYCEGMI